MRIKVNDLNYKKIKEQLTRPLTCFVVNECTEPYKLVEEINQALNKFGLEIIRIVKSERGCYDPPYCFSVSLNIDAIKIKKKNVKGL